MQKTPFSREATRVIKSLFTVGSAVVYATLAVHYALNDSYLEAAISSFGPCLHQEREGDPSFMVRCYNM